MQAINRWRNWKPQSEKLNESPGSELTKPTKPSPEPVNSTFVSFVSTPPHTQNFFDVEPDIPEDAPVALRDAFWSWVKAECVMRPRCFGGIGSLHVHFSDWTIANDAVPCTRHGFERLLAREGFLTADGMVSELVLKDDWDACHTN